MYKNGKVLAVVPARGGSKGIPGKNLMTIGGISLIGHVGNIIKELEWVDKGVLSTDEPLIAREGERHGLAVPFVRPTELSGDRASAVETWRHALLLTERIEDVQYDYTVLLEPTSPLRKPEQVTQTIEKLVLGDHDAVMTVTETDSKYHPSKQFFLKGDRLNYFDPAGKLVVARQQLSPLYHANGIAYAMTRKRLLHPNHDKKKVLNSNTAAIVITDDTVNIDTLFDIELAEYLFQKSFNR